MATDISTLAATLRPESGKGFARRLRMKGLIPVELMGRTRFPTVGDMPYLLTLGGYDFYWFSLEAPRGATQEQRMSDLGPVWIPCTSARELLVQYGALRSDRGRRGAGGGRREVPVPMTADRRRLPWPGVWAPASTERV